MIRFAAASVFVLVLAGCTQPAPAGSAFDRLWYVQALESGEGHDHANATQHLGLTTPNFHVLGHDPLFSPYYGKPAGATLCGDAGATADGRRLAIVESRSKVGFAIADVTDAAAPRWLGEVVMENSVAYDVAIVPDGRHVVAVTSELTGTPVPLPVATATWRTPCAPEQPVPYRVAADRVTDPVPSPAQILLFDISDPASPVVVDRQPLSGYGHSVFSTAIDGRTWVLATTFGPAIPNVPGGATSGWEFLEVEETAAGARLHLLSTYYARDVAGGGTDLGDVAHDGWIAKHPGTGQTLAYLVGGNILTILDLADPTAPQRLSTWSDVVAGRDGLSGNFHSVVPMDRLWNGRHYTVSGAEFATHPTGIPSPVVWVLDTTDPAAPREVAGWTLPHDVVWDAEYLFSTHYYGIHNETLFVSMYHGGIWAVDLAPVLDHPGAPFASLPSIGVFLPVDPAADPAVKLRWTPTLEEALPFADGTLVTFDGYTGLWTFTFDATDPAPAPPPWPISPPHPSQNQGPT